MLAMRTVIIVSFVLFQLGDMIPKSKWKLITVDEDGDADDGNGKMLIFKFLHIAEISVVVDA